MTRWMYACVVAGLALSPMGASAQDSPLTIRETDAAFEDVVADLQDAIVNRLCGGLPWPDRRYAGADS